MSSQHKLALLPDIIQIINKMLATDWLSDVSQCLADTLEAGIKISNYVEVKNKA